MAITALSRIVARLALVAGVVLLSVFLGVAATAFVSEADAARFLLPPPPRTTDAASGDRSVALTPANLSATQESVSVRYIVTYRPGVIPESQAAQIVSAGATPGRLNARLRSQGIFVSAATSAQVVDALRANPQVLSVSVDNVRSMATAPNDPGYAQQWALTKIGWDQVYGTVIPSGTSIVAVLDAGIDASHPDLAGRVIAGTSILDGSDGRTDASGHGTSLAGIIAAQTNNVTGIAGVGFAGVTVMPVSVLDADGVGYDSDIIDGITYAADHGANVILMAFSNPRFSTELQAAIDYAWNLGVLVVAATGNEGSPIPTYPAGAARVIGVSNTDESDALAPSSNYGTDTFLAAPGTGISTTAVGGGYTTVTGTSASAALVAGSAALMRAIDPSLTNGVVVGRLARAADAVGTVAKIGNGRLNLARAVADTSIDSMTPAGSGGSGDPSVGPYAAAGTSGSLRPTGNGGVQGTGWLNTAGTQCTINGANCHADVSDSGNSTYIQKGTQTNIDASFNIDVSSVTNGYRITAISVTFTCAGVGNTSTVQAIRRVDGGAATASGSNATCANGTPTQFTQNFTGLNITKGASTDLEVGVRGVQNRAVRVYEISATVTVIASSSTGSLLPTGNGGVQSTGWLNTAGTQCAVNGTNCYADVSDSSNSTYIQKSTQTNIDSSFNIDLSSVTNGSAITAIAVTFVCAGVGNTSTAQTIWRVDGGTTTASGSNATCANGTPTQFTQNFTGLSITKGASTDLEIGVRGSQNRALRVYEVSASLTITAGDPTFTSVTPSSRGEGVVNQDLAVVGTGFQLGATVAFSGTGITVNSTTVNSSTSLTANVTIAAGATVGARSLTITNPDFGAVTTAGVFTVNAAPTFTSVTPSSRGQGSTNQDLAVVGTGFAASAAVTFGGTGITVNSTTFNSATSLTVNVTISGSATSGARSLTVTNTDGGTSTASDAFTVNAAPTFTSVTPESLHQGATSQDLAVAGTGFAVGAVVTFSGTGITVNSTTFDNATSLTVNVTVSVAAATDARSLTVTNPDGGAVSAGAAFSVAAAPTFTSVTPSSRGQGATNQDLTIAGTGFATGAAVTFSGTGITVNSTTFNSTTSLTASVTISAAATAGARDLTITNADASTVTALGAFTVVAAPMFTSVTPSSRGQGVVNEDLAVVGTGFQSGATVAFGGTGITVNSTTVNSATSLTANVTIAVAAPTGARDITITNPDFGTVNASGAFTVNAAPTITSVTPVSLQQGSANQDLAVVGAGFAAGAAVTFSGTGITVNSTTFNSATSLTVNVTISGSATSGARNLTVTNADGGTVTASNAFTVDAAPVTAGLAFTSITPTNLSQGATSRDLVIIGTAFDSGTEVTFSGTGITVNSTTLNSSTSLTVNITVAGSAPVGARDIRVENGDGSAVVAGAAFVVTAAPTFTSLTPANRGQGAASYDLVVVGTNFAEGAAVTFSGTGVTVNSTTVNTSTSITANVAVGSSAAVGARDLTLTNPDGSAVTAIGAFTVNAAPTLISITPTNLGQGALNQDVVIRGTNFTPGTVLVSDTDGVIRNSVTFVDSTTFVANVSIEATAPTGVRTFTVINPDGGSSTAAGQFVRPGPVFTSVTPLDGGQGTVSQDLTVVGANFLAGAAVTFSGTGITVNSTTVNNATSLTVNVTISGSAAATARDLTILNGDAGRVTAAGAFTIHPAPTFTSVTPTSLAQGATSRDLAIVGTEFHGSIVVTFSGAGITVNSTTLNSSTSLTINITVADSAPVGARDIRVEDDAGHAVVASAAFIVTAAPTFTSLTPASRAQGATNENLTIVGTNFAPGTMAAFSGTDITVNSTAFNSSTSLLVNISVASGAAPGPRSLTVTNPDGSAVIAAAAFTVSIAPTFTSLTPSSLSQGTANQSLAIIGTNFVDGERVTFSGSGITVISTTFNSPTSLTAIVSVASSAEIGARALTVVNGDGGSVSVASALTVTASLVPGPGPDSSSPPIQLIGSLDLVTGLPQVIGNISPTQATVVTTAATMSAQVDGSVPAGIFTLSVPIDAISGATFVVLQSVSSIANLVASAPLPPGGGQLMLAVAVRAFDADGNPITAEFAQAVSISAIIPADAVPANASLADFVLVSWSGDAWVEVPTRVTFTADGGVRADASVTHAAMYALKYGGLAGLPSPAAGFAAVPVFGTLRLALAVFQGQAVEQLEIAARVAGASGVWAQDDAGAYRLLIVDGPAFVTEQFAEAFPDGFSGAIAVTLVQR